MDAGGSEKASITVTSALPDIASYQAIFSIEGMTCSSCVGNASEALRKVQGVVRADVSLVNMSATVEFGATESQAFVEALIEAVEDVGYGIELTEVKPASAIHRAHTKERSGSGRVDSRTVSLRVNGMHCSQCPSRILATLEALDIEVERPPELKHPILTITYVPSAPNYTVRSIISKIAAIDTSFSLSVYHPQSVEERSRKMLSKERTSIFRRVLFTTATAIPTFMIGIVYMDLLSHQNPGYQYLMQPLHGVSRAEWATFIMATPVYFYGADIFHKRAIRELYALWRPRSTIPILRRLYRFGSMNLLISLGTTIAYFSSLGELISAASHQSRQMLVQSSKHSYFDSVVFLSMFLLIGRLIEAHMKAKSGDAVAALGKLRPTEATLVQSHDEQTKVETVDVDLIDIGDIVRVMQGSAPPCDGILVDKHGEFDESSLTGESRVVRKVQGDEVYSGTINKGAAISVRANKPAGASLLDSIIQVVREGQAKRAPVERVADLLTGYFVPVVVLIAIITWTTWLALGLSGALPESYLEVGSESWLFWSLQFAIAVFVIACPCGLGLAAPTALFVGGGVAASRGILVKGGGEAFQEASDLDAVIFDKTGTLTEGSNPKIVEHRMFTGNSPIDGDAILGILGAIEGHSSHPLAKAAVEFTASHDSASVHLESAEEIAGQGLKAFCTISADAEKHGCEALVGNESLMRDYGVLIPGEVSHLIDGWKASGYSIVLLSTKFAEQWEVRAALAAADPLRAEAKEVIAALHAQHITVWMLSGDNEKTAAAVGAQVGIAPENIIAGVLPAQKADKVKQLQRSAARSSSKGLFSALMNRRKRASIAMVGDGINDAPALAAADVGIAVASGSDVAVQSAAFVLVHSDLRAVLTLVTLSRAVFRRVIQNFFWAAIYNVIALPIAAGVLYPIMSNGSHVRLDPAWAALAMALSSITVVCSSLMLRTRLPLVGFRDGKAGSRSASRGKIPEP